MLFTTWSFAALLVVTFLLYYLLPRLGRPGGPQITVLLVSSFIFYAYETPALSFLLLFSILVNSWLSISIIRSFSEGKPTKKWMSLGVVINLLLLGFFKYAGFLARSFLPENEFQNLITDLEGIPLPVGISFFTFQAISLLVDLHRGDSGKMASLSALVEERKTLEATHRVGFFIAFFPQLVAGPIVKAKDFFHQIGTKTISNVPWEHAIKCLIAGLFLKMYVADNLKEVTVLLGERNIVQRIDLIFLIYGYSFQIFADFAGYSLIAIGLAALFGYRLPINFNFPYISSSITEFWRRWHISLSTWLREYLYFPLGGNRKGAARTYFNLFIVMLLGGLWHGAAWSYMIWGGAHGIFLAIERFAGSRFKLPDHGFFKVGRALVVFHLVSVLWLLFLLPNFEKVAFVGQCFANGSWTLSPQIIYCVLVFGSPVVLYHLWTATKSLPWLNAIHQTHPRLHWWGYACLLFLIITNSGSTGAFVYFQF